MESVLTKVQGMLRAQFSLSEAQVASEQVLDALGMDSLAKIEFMYKLEDEFAISLAEDRSTLETVSDIVKIVEGALAAKSENSTSKA